MSVTISLFYSVIPCDVFPISELREQILNGEERERERERERVCVLSFPNTTHLTSKRWGL